MAEFCFAELGATVAMSDTSARRLVAAALDLLHRLSHLWQQVQTGVVKAWVARQVTETTRHLSAETVAVVDTEIARYADRLSWPRLQAIDDAAWMQTDPDAANQADTHAEARLGVWLDPSPDHGTKTVVMNLHAPDAIRFDATLDRCADGLAVPGDERAKDLRRAAAVAVLANPQTALDLFDHVAAAAGVDLGTPRKDTTRATDSRPRSP